MSYKSEIDTLKYYIDELDFDDEVLLKKIAKSKIGSKLEVICKNHALSKIPKKPKIKKHSLILDMWECGLSDVHQFRGTSDLKLHEENNGWYVVTDDDTWISADEVIVMNEKIAIKHLNDMLSGKAYLPIAGELGDDGCLKASIEDFKGMCKKAKLSIKKIFSDPNFNICTCTNSCCVETEGELYAD